MDARQVLLKALSVLSQISAGHPPTPEEVAFLKQYALPHESRLKVDQMARAIIRRESQKETCRPDHGS